MSNAKDYPDMTAGDRSRLNILQAREEALQARRTCESVTAAGETISRDQHADLAVSALAYHSQLSPYEDNAAVDDYPDLTALERHCYGNDGHVADNAETQPETIVEMIDGLEAVANKLGFVPERVA